MEHLLGRQRERVPASAYDWRVQGRSRRVLCARTLRGQARVQSVYLVRHHTYLMPLGASLLSRWRKNLGDELDHGIHQDSRVAAVSSMRQATHGILRQVLDTPLPDERDDLYPYV